MRKMKKIASLILCLALVVGMTSCGKKTDEGQSGDKPVVVYCAQLMTSLNSFTTASYPDYYIATNVYETLVTINDDGSVEPCLAESWDIDESGTTYTFHLVDAKFHNGDDFKASDVAFSYEFAKQFPFADRYINMVESVKVIDDKTIEFTLNGPCPMFLPYAQNVRIFCENYVKNSEDPEMKNVECGTGPYTVASFDGGNNCELAAFADYRKGEPAIKTVQLRYISDSASAAVSFEAGEITVMDAPVAQGKELMKNDKYSYELRTPLHTAVIAFNCEKAPFDNKLVRQAFSYAANKEQMIQVAYEGMAVPAIIQADTNAFGVDYSKVDEITYDPEKAKELLAEAGYKDGLNLTEMGIVMKMIPGGYFEKYAQVYQQNLADIGVTVELEATETPDEDAMAGDFTIMTEGLSYSADFSYNQYHYCKAGFGNVNFDRYTNPKVEEMFAEADKVTDNEKRKEMYKDLIAYIVEECPSLPIMHRQNIYLFDKNLNATFHDNSASCYHFWEWSWK